MPVVRLLRRARTLTVVVLLAAVVTAAAPSTVLVRPGDTLSELALRHRTSVATLQALNGLPGNATLYAGARLRLPGARGTARSSRRVERGHTVRRGETLSGIAARYGTSVQAVRVRNRLPRSGLVQVGRRLAIPVRTTARSTPSAPATSVRIPSSVRRAAAASRARLRGTRQPSKAAVRRMVARTARKHGVSPSLAVSVAYHESGFQQRVVSGVNAIGVMQVLPSTGRVLSRQHGRRLDLYRAQDNVTAGVLLLRQLLRSTGSERMALAGYYQGLGSIARKGLLPQTHAYIRSIGHLRGRFARG